MITHIYVARLKPGTPDATVANWLEAIDGLAIEGMDELRSGPDLNLREGNDDVAITADFTAVDAWHRYNDDARHNEIRAELAKPIVESQQRIQFLRNRHFDVAGDVRNVTLVTLKKDAPADQATKIAERLVQLRCRGMHHIYAGVDLGLQPGNATFGVICDFDDPEAYSVYDLDDLHNQIRAEDAKPYTEAVRRVQFELPPTP